MNASSTCALSVPVWRHCATKLRLRPLGDGLHREHRERDGDDRDEREQRRDRDHHDQHADERQRRREQLAQRLLQALREVVDVVGDPAQHVAARLAVDVAQRHAVELVLDVRAQAGTWRAARLRRARTPAGTGAPRTRRRCTARRAGSCAARVKSMPWPLMTPSTMTLVALPRIRGAITASVTLETARIRTPATPRPSGRNRAASRRVEFLKSFDRSSGMPTAPHRPPNPPRASPPAA